MQITAKKFLSYTLLPQVGPRLRTLMSGFTFIGFFLAQIYRAVGLLPADHPYLSSANIGKYGISHVLSETGLVLKRKNAPIDQKIVYWALMTGVVVLAAQFMLMVAGSFVMAAHAADADWGDIISQPQNWFVTKDPADDLAFMLLDRVFGLKDMFKSCVSLNAPCFTSGLPANDYYTDSSHTATTAGTFPNAYHYAIQSAFQLYSVALLVIAAIILTYFIGAVIAETAQSGTPFGQRFNKTWAPIRLVVALGLLIPVANGLNAAQYITLYAAKFGSGFATNGWNMFVDTAVTGDNTILGNKNTLVAVANPPPITTLFSFMALVGACKALTEKESQILPDDPKITIKPYLINPNNNAMPYKVEDAWDFDQALTYSDNGAIIVRFGEYREVKGKPVYTQATSNVNPTCGELTIPVTNTDKDAAPGALKVMQDYYTYLGQMWKDATTGGTSPLYTTGQAVLAFLPNPGTATASPTTAQIVQARDAYQQEMQKDLTDATQEQQNSQSLKNTADGLKQYGWGAAGLWYNKLAQINSTLIAAVYNLPQVTHFPQVMENGLKQNQAHNVNISGGERFRPHGANGQIAQFAEARDDNISLGMAKAYDIWSDNFSEQSVSDNAIVNAINAIFGSSGLFTMSQNQDQQINPLAQLVAVGRGILESAQRNLLYAAVAGIGGGVINLATGSNAGNIGLALSGFIWSVAVLGLSIGVVMTYVLPFLPFLYFFFAVGGWVKAIFEAMVGVPLWALAHLRIDGPGLPGEAAMGGYYLVLDIFLRPILIIFGMLGGIVIFVAQATVLNDIWPLVTSNLAGFDRAHAASVSGDAPGAMRYIRDAIDQLFFSAVYALVIYMLGMASFKMVDQVPANVLRWMGATARGFAEEGQTPEYLLGKVWGAQQLAGRLNIGGASPGAAAGSAIGGLRKG